MDLLPVIEDFFLDLKSVVAITTISKTTIYSLVSEGKFPPPFKIAGTRRAVWRASAVNAWIALQGDETNAG